MTITKTRGSVSRRDLLALSAAAVAASPIAIIATEARPASEDPILALWDERNRLFVIYAAATGRMVSLESGLGFEAAEEEHDAAYEPLRAVEMRILHAPAATAEGLGVKLWLASYWALDGSFPLAEPEVDVIDGGLVLAALYDVSRLHGLRIVGLDYVKGGATRLVGVDCGRLVA